MHRPSIRLLARIAVLLGIDQLSKLAVRSFMQPGDSIRLLPFLRIDYLRNPGIAFGYLEGHAFTIIVTSSVIVAMLLLAAVVVRHDRRWHWPFALLGAGAIGNLLDRVWLGSVTDFIRLPHWPAFNFADIFIVTGVCLLILNLVRQPENDGGEALWFEQDESGWADGEGRSWQDDDVDGQDEWDRLAMAGTDSERTPV